MSINLRNKKTGAEIHLKLKPYPTDKPFGNLKNLADTPATKRAVALAKAIKASNKIV